MIKRIFKKTPIIIITAILLSIPINTIYAYTFDVKFAATGENKNNGNNSNNEDPWINGDKTTKNTGGNETPGATKTTETWQCRYKYNVSSTNNVTINGYDINENKNIINKSLKISNDDKITAGTSIGLEIYERKTVSYKVGDISVKYTKKVSTYTKTGGGYYKNRIFHCVLKKCWGRQKEYNTYEYNETKCNSVKSRQNCKKGEGYGYQYSDWVPATYEWKQTSNDTYYITSKNYNNQNNTNQKKYDDCEKQAIRAAVKEANSRFGATYKLEIPNSNDTSKSNTEKVIKGAEPAGKITKFELNTELENDAKTATKTAKYIYSTIPCMNVITSEVNYVDTREECNNNNTNKKIIENGKAVENGVTHTYWHYFVPLNAKSNDEINVSLVKNAEKSLKSSQCQYVVEQHPADSDTPYYDLIQPLDKDGEKKSNIIFTKMSIKKYINDCKNQNKNCRSAQDYNKFKKSEWTCYLTSTIKIPITQQFYKEKETTKNNKTTITFTGFKFYYRSVNINDPFPNGIKNTTSAWYEWYKKYKNNDKKLSPNIEQSYKTVSYQALSINTSSVRKYNENKIYSNWNGMTKDGKSSFITNEGIVTRKTTGKIFKIGGGPRTTISDKSITITKKGGG